MSPDSAVLMCTIVFDFNYVQLKTFILISCLFSSNWFYQKYNDRYLVDIFHNRDSPRPLFCAHLFRLVLPRFSKEKNNFVSNNLPEEVNLISSFVITGVHKFTPAVLQCWIYNFSPVPNCIGTHNSNVPATSVMSMSCCTVVTKLIVTMSFRCSGDVPIWKMFSRK